MSDFMADENSREAVGRAWKADELRLKSHDDLHKLWYVMLIEKNKLKSDKILCIQMGQLFYGSERLRKVRLGMRRLLTVVNERKKIRNEYRRILEDRYIEEKKAEEQARIDEDLRERRAAGEEGVAMPTDELHEFLRSKSEEKR